MIAGVGRTAVSHRRFERSTDLRRARHRTANLQPWDEWNWIRD